MNFPTDIDEAEFVAMTAKIAEVLHAKFGWVHGGADDYAQQVMVWSLEALPRYDRLRPLGGFLFAHVRNRSFNALRDKVSRNDGALACARCHAGTPCGQDGVFCPKYRRWFDRNQLKSKLAQPAGLEYDAEYVGPSTRAESTAEDVAAARELAALIDREMPPRLRGDYLQLLSGDQVVKYKRDRVERAVTDILQRAGVEFVGDVVDLSSLVIKPPRKERKTGRRKVKDGETPPAFTPDGPELPNAAEGFPPGETNAEVENDE